MAITTPPLRGNHELAFQRCFMGYFSFEYLIILFNLKQKYMIAVLT